MTERTINEIKRIENAIKAVGYRNIPVIPHVPGAAGTSGGFNRKFPDAEPKKAMVKTNGETHFIASKSLYKYS